MSIFSKIKSFFTTAKEQPADVPYKVEPAQCGCGRSPTGLCVGLHKLSDADWAVHADNPKKSAPVKVDAVVVAPDAVVPESITPKKAPAKKQQFEKKAAAPKAEAKPKAPPKPRAPRKPATK